MNFVLDNSVAMCWLLSGGKPADVAYADSVLTALKQEAAKKAGVEFFALK